MAASEENLSMALFCDFENVALGVRDANYEKFDIKPILERLLLKGSIVVKKAYCDWDRYKTFKGTMHEANFELIEIPHVRQSGKNSADIRLVVDALDLCYTKSHVNTFVIISGDSDFSPLVSKLRENAKKVIGVGVKQSTSDLLVANCDEFIFYDDLVRESRRTAAKRDTRDAPAAPRRSPAEEKVRREDLDARRNQAIEITAETFEALVAERGDSGKIWASVLKEAIKRRKPDFSESYYGFRSFGNLLELAQSRGLLEFGRDEKSGAYVYRSSGNSSSGSSSNNGAAAGMQESNFEPAAAEPPSAEAAAHNAESEENAVATEPRRRSRGGRKPAARRATPADLVEAVEVAAVIPKAILEVIAATIPAPIQASSSEAIPAALSEAQPAAKKRREPRGARAAKAKTSTLPDAMPAPVPAQVPAPAPAPAAVAETATASPARPASRSRRPRKPAVKVTSE